MVCFLGSFIYSLTNSLGAWLGRGSALGVGDVVPVGWSEMLPTLQELSVGEERPTFSHLATLTQEVKFCHSGFLPKSFFWGLCAHENTNMSSVSQGITSITLFSALVSLNCTFYR